MGTRSSSSNGSWAGRSATAVSISCLSLMRCWTSSSGAGVLLLLPDAPGYSRLSSSSLRNRHRHVSHLFRNAFNYHHLEHRDVNILLYCVLQNGTSWSNAFVHGSSCEGDGQCVRQQELALRRSRRPLEQCNRPQEPALYRTRRLWEQCLHRSQRFVGHVGHWNIEWVHGSRMDLFHRNRRHKDHGCRFTHRSTGSVG